MLVTVRCFWYTKRAFVKKRIKFPLQTSLTSSWTNSACCNRPYRGSRMYFANYEASSTPGLIEHVNWIYLVNTGKVGLNGMAATQPQQSSNSSAFGVSLISIIIFGVAMVIFGLVIGAVFTSKILPEQASEQAIATDGLFQVLKGHGKDVKMSPKLCSPGSRCFHQQLCINWKPCGLWNDKIYTNQNSYCTSYRISGNNVNWEASGIWHFVNTEWKFL